ncbi:hypothetical protein P879_05704 [Paragonimus westermani]|uniref:Vacuolar protein sorting-associated protein 16 homolog n=1 Tax=Paragonimus westermani TaxID=34504 RepID=A0A8T0DNU2_9TREM|nr:hypothetical protein P879_05704 [Paragonimus westermani]
MKSLGEDWFAIGDVYFRYIHLFDMPWGPGFSFSHFKLAACGSSGHLAMLLGSQPGSKPVLQIYTASGKLVSQQLWKDAPPLIVGWSLSEDLLVVQKSGFVSVLDLNGNYVRRFSMGPDAEERNILDARFFSMNAQTGVAILTGGNHILLTSSIETPRIRRLAGLSGPAQPFGLWEVITTPLDTGAVRAGATGDAFRSPWVLIARKKTVFRADFSTTECVELPALNQLVYSQIQLLAVSSNMKFVGLYLDCGILLVTNLRMSEVHSQLDLAHHVSVMLPTCSESDHAVSELEPTTVAQLNHPKQMLWVTSSAVVLHWTHLIALVGSQADIHESFCPEDMWMTQEVDSVRILTPTAHKLLQRVPPALEALGRIGASSPATWLLSASASLRAGSGRTNDYLLLIRTARQMIEAISHCLEAASHSVLDVECQQALLEAARMGRIFLSAMFTDPKDRPTDAELKRLGEHAARVCRCLRLLNSLAAPWIGLALTWLQFQKLGFSRLLERLLVRKQYPMALELVRNMPESDFCLQSDSPKHQSRTTGFTRVLAHWACHSSVAGSEDSLMIAERLARIVDRIRRPHDHSHQEAPSVDNPVKSVSSSGNVSINFAEVASQALVAKREKVAEQLLEYEMRARQQVPLLIKLGRYSRALVRAVESGNPELIAEVVAALQDQAKLPPADLALVLRKHPIAMAIYHETWEGSTLMAVGRSGSRPDNTAMTPETHGAVISFGHEHDRTAEAKKSVLLAYRETNLQLRINGLQRAEEIYKQLKNDFMAQECNAAVRLLRFQSKLEKQEVQAPVFDSPHAVDTTSATLNASPLIVPTLRPSSVQDKLWIGQSLNTTLARLLAVPQDERLADQLRREFRVSEKRYAHLRLIGLAVQNDCWVEVEKMTKAKRPPVSIETLIKVCIDGNHFEEAQKLIPRLPTERRVRYWLLCGQLEEAIHAAVREKSDTDLCFILERVGKGNRILQERISALRRQIR